MAFSHIKSQVQIPLSMQELLSISQNILQDYAPCIVQRRMGGVVSAFSSKELLAISQEINREYTLNITARNESELVLMPIESGKLHVYWQFDQQKNDKLVHDYEDKPLALRIYEEPAKINPDTTEQMLDAESALWFDIAIEANKTQQDVILPSHAHDSVSLSAEIGYYTDASHFTPIIRSKSAMIPKSLILPDKIALPASVAQFIIPLANTNSVSSPIRTFS